MNEIIQLQKAANGWIVILPYQYLPVSGVENFMSSPEEAAKFFRKVKDQLDNSEDDIMNKIRRENQEQEYSEIRVPVPARQPNNMYIFSSYDEASSFIKSRYDN